MSAVLAACVCCEVPMSQLPARLADTRAVQLHVFSSGHCLLCVTLSTGDRRGGRSAWILFWSSLKTQPLQEDLLLSYIAEGLFSHPISTC